MPPWDPEQLRRDGVAGLDQICEPGGLACANVGAAFVASPKSGAANPHAEPKGRKDSASMALPGVKPHAKIDHAKAWDMVRRLRAAARALTSPAPA